jgi:hypothetical protein
MSPSDTRDISHSSVERVTLPDSTILLDYMLHRITEIVANQFLPIVWAGCQKDARHDAMRDLAPLSLSLQMDSHYLSLLEKVRGVRREGLPGGRGEAQLTAAGCGENCVVRSVWENRGGGLNSPSGACRKNKSST